MEKKSRTFDSLNVPIFFNGMEGVNDVGFFIQIGIIIARIKNIGPGKYLVHSEFSLSAGAV